MTHWKTIAIVAGIILMVYGGFLFAQTQQPPPARGGRGDQDPRMEQMIDMMFRDMDVNHDGKISKNEWMAFYERQFRQLDKSGRGFITRDDVRADMTERMRAGQQQQQQQQQQRPPGPPQY
jgi:Ca2+-binding EF-hand superfamily protein